jgi:hypothetical protein
MGWDLSSRRVLLFAVPLAAFALLRDLSALAPFNAFANAALLCGCAAVVFCEFDEIQRTGHTAPVRWAAPTGIPVFFGIMVGALEGACDVFCSASFHVSSAACPVRLSFVRAYF